MRAGTALFEIESFLGAELALFDEVRGGNELVASCFGGGGGGGGDGMKSARPVLEVSIVGSGLSAPDDERSFRFGIGFRLGGEGFRVAAGTGRLGDAESPRFGNDCDIGRAFCMRLAFSAPDCMLPAAEYIEPFGPRGDFIDSQSFLTRVTPLVLLAVLAVV